MKVTAKNVIDKWDEIKPLLPAELAKIGEESFLPYADLYDDFDEEMIQDFELFLEKVNKYTDKPATKTSKRNYVRGNGKKYRKKKPAPKKDKDTSKKDKTTKKEPKSKQPLKSTKTKLAEAPNWLKTLRSFKNAAGKERTVTGIRKMVMEIQDRFDAKRGLKTPHITLIREIQDKLLPYANRQTAKVQLPQWDDLVARCKTAIATVSVSSKETKDDLKASTLSGTHRKRKAKKSKAKKSSKRKTTKRKPKK